MYKVYLAVCVGVCVISMALADCYLDQDFMCTKDSVESAGCYNCTCLGNGYTRCCRKASSMRPSGFPKTCKAVYKKKTCSWKVVDRGDRSKPCDYTSVVG